MMMVISQMTLSKRGSGPLERAAMDVSIIKGDARSVLHVATRSLIADIVTMKLRTIRSITRLTDTLWRRSSVPSAITSKMFNKFAKTAVCAWANTFLRSASDDDTSKQQYHCDKCGICKTGGRENFFHCDRCGCCYSTQLCEGHTCIENSMHHDCPVCMEYLFDSVKDITVLPCSHTLHLECLQDMHKHYQYNCPLCSKSVCDMSSIWKQIDKEIYIYITYQNLDLAHSS